MTMIDATLATAMCLVLSSSFVLSGYLLPFGKTSLTGRSLSCREGWQGHSPRNGNIRTPAGCTPGIA